jgi:hypothetical protein
MTAGTANPASRTSVQYGLVALAGTIWGIHALEHVENLHVFPAVVNELALGDLMPIALSALGIAVIYK